MGNKETKSDVIQLIPAEGSSASVEDRWLDDREDIALIWYSSSVVSPEIHVSLRKISSEARFFYSEEECMNCVKTETIEKIFLIVSSDIHEDLLNEFNSADVIDSIFIYSDSTEATTNTIFNKIIGIYTSTIDLAKSIRKTIRLCEKQLAAFSFYNQEEKNTRNLTEESGSFLFFQLFKDVLLNMPQTPESKREMIEKCKDYYRRKAKELEVIEQFNKTYKSTQAIQWYSKDSFVYRLLNKALRTEDIMALYTFRYFIIDLCNDLRSKYNVFKRKQQNLKLYRGVKLSMDEIQRLNENIGHLISHNGFMSTTRLYSVARDFATKSSKRQTESVVFEIDMDLKIANKILLADVAERSDYPEEQEVLFDLGAAFKIKSCNYDSLNHLWLIETTATNEGIEIANDYVEYQKKKVLHSDIVLMFGHLLADMGQNVKSEKYFKAILDQHPNDEEKACIHHNMGRVYRLKEEYDQALKSYRRSYEMHQSAQPQRLVSAAKSLNGIGIVYNESHKYDLAIEHFTRALKIYEESLSKHHADIAGALNNLANVYQDKGEYDRALENLKRAQNIYDRTLPKEHPHRATTLNNAGNVYYKKTDYKQALDCYLQALQIREKALPSDHIDLLRTHDNLGVVYYASKQYIKAFEHFKKAHEIAGKTLSDTSSLAVQIKTHLDLAEENCRQ